MKYDPIAEAYTNMYFESEVNKVKSDDSEEDSDKDAEDEEDKYPSQMKKQKIPMLLMKMAKVGILK